MLLKDVEITPSDYLDIEDDDLEMKLTQVVFSSSPTMSAQKFINKIKRKCINWLLDSYNNDGTIQESAIPLFKEGVILQVSFVLDNGDKAKENGFNQENNTIINIDAVKEFDLDAQRCFRLAGLMNRKKFDVL